MQPPMEQNVDERSIVRCPNPKCRAQVRLPSNREGEVRCPSCTFSFWTTTRAGNPIRKALLILLRNQRGIAAAVAVIALLAVGWMAAIWMARETMAHTLEMAAVGSALSFSLVWWLSRRPGATHVLLPALKELRLFFGMYLVAFLSVLGLQYWRGVTTEPDQVSLTLLELERLRASAQSGFLVEFVKSGGWKAFLLGLSFLLLLLPIARLRSAIRGTTKAVGQGIRMSIYLLAAFSAFTFSGMLSDGTLSRRVAVIASQVDGIRSAYAAYSTSVEQTALDEVAQWMLDEDDDSEGEQSQANVAKSPTAPPSTNGTDDGRAIGPRKPGNPPGGNGSPQQRARLSDTLRSQLQQELRQATESLRSATSEISREPRVPPSSARSTDVRTWTAESQKPVRNVAAPSNTEARTADLRAAVRQSLGFAMTQLPRPSSVAGPLVEAHPYGAQLNSLMSALGDGPVQSAVREVVGEAIDEGVRKYSSNLRTFVREMLVSRTGGNRFAALRDVHARARQLVKSISDAQDLLRQTNAKPAIVNREIYLPVARHFEEAVANAAKQVPENRRAIATDVAERLASKYVSQPAPVRARYQLEDLARIDTASTGADLESKFASLELDRLATSTISDAIAQDRQREQVAANEAEAARQRTTANKKGDALAPCFCGSRYVGMRRPSMCRGPC